jgi:hypothetical protein
MFTPLDFGSFSDAIFQLKLFRNSLTLPHTIVSHVEFKFWQELSMYFKILNCPILVFYAQ